MFLRVALAASLVSGCALTTATPITEDNPNPSGFVVNTTNTVFVQDSTGLRPVTYSDPCKRYAVNFWAVAASNTSTLTLSEAGTLESIAATLDSTAIPLKVLDLAGKVIDKIPEGFSAASTPVSGVDSKVRFFDVQCGERGKSYLVERSTVGEVSTAAVRANPPKPAGTVIPDLIK